MVKQVVLMEESMRTSGLVCVGVGLILAAGGMLRGADDATTSPDRIARLVLQLGHDDYDRREAANAELEAIGEPALPALREALESSDDAEIQHRAGEIIPTILDRAANDDQKKLQGAWTLVSREESGKKAVEEDKPFTLTIAGNLWVRKQNNAVVQQGTCMFVDPTGQPRRVDLILIGGGVAHGVCQIEGDTLKVCAHNSPDGRPTDFTTKEGDGRTSEVWKRAKP
jgi:uncharacterized protein (TIGR03067 family)